MSSNSFFLRSGTPFLLQRSTDRQHVVIQNRMFGRNFLKWTKWACHIKEINWQHLLPVVEFELFNENFKFLENFAATPVSLTASQYSKTYLRRLAVKLMNGFVWFFFSYNLRKFVSIQKTGMTLWANIFQMTNSWCGKIVLW